MKLVQPTFSGFKSFIQLPTQLDNEEIPDVNILGVPFDLGTTYRPGARFGPSSIRHASMMLNSGDDISFRINPKKILKIIDMGDLNIANGYLEESLELIEEQIIEIDGHTISMGGDHTITLPILRGLSEKHGKGISLVQFDAHLDTRDNNFGMPFGHGTPFHYLSKENIVDPKKSVQIGIRSQVHNSVMDYTKGDLGFTIITSEDVHLAKNLDLIVKKIKRTIGKNNVYLTFDIDSIDPSQAPGTGTPEIGGLFTWQVLYILKQLTDLNWIGMDLVEVAPMYDQSEITSLAGATIIWVYLCLLASNK